MEGIDTNSAQIDASARGRLLAWEAALSMASDYPLGVGEGNFKKYIGQYNPEMIGRDTHNTFLRCLAELGVQGAFVLLLLIGNAFWILFRLKKKIQDLPQQERFLVAYLCSENCLNHLSGSRNIYYAYIYRRILLVVNVPGFLEEIGGKRN